MTAADHTPSPATDGLREAVEALADDLHDDNVEHRLRAILAAHPAPPSETATCWHAEPERECASCAACAACDGECGTCPYSPPVPQPAPPSSSDADREGLSAIVEADGWEGVAVADLMSIAAEAIAWELLNATSDTADRWPSKEAHEEALATARRILAARAQPEGKTRVEWPPRLNDAVTINGIDGARVRTVEALFPDGHYRVTVDVPEVEETQP